jgi:hypothetical protein
MADVLVGDCPTDVLTRVETSHPSHMLGKRMTIPPEPIGSIPRPFRLVRGTAFAVVRARVVGTELAALALGGK